MSFIRKNRSKTFWSILITITLTMVLVVSLFSNVLYKRFEAIGLQMTYDHNVKIISHITGNIDYMNEMVDNFMISQYLEPGTEQLMYGKQTDYFFSQKFINNFKRVVNGNNIIHSAMIYNDYIHELYSTSNYGMFAPDPEILTWIDQVDEIPIVTPIPRILPMGFLDETVEVFTYFIYEKINPNGRPNAALIVNVKTDWLQSNMQKYNKKDAYFMLIDQSNRLIINGSGKNQMFDTLSPSISDHIIVNEQGGSFVIDEDLGKRIITYLPIPGSDWIILSNESYETVFEPISHIKNQTILYTIIFLLLVIVISVYVARKIYKPFGNLVEQVKSGFNDSITSSEYHYDHEYLSSVFKNNMNKIGIYEEYRNTTANILKENALKSIVGVNRFYKNDPIDVHYEELQEIFQDHHRYVLIIFKLDQAHVFKELNLSEQKLITFAMFNMGDELLGESSRFLRSLINQESFLYLLSYDHEDEKTLPLLKKSILEIQRLIYKISNHNFTVTGMISGWIHQKEQVTLTYNEMERLFDYKIFYDHESLLMADELASRLTTTDEEYPIELAERLIQSMKSENQEEVNQSYYKIRDLLMNGSRENFLYALLRLAVSIHKVVQDINQNKMFIIKIQFNEFCSELMKANALNEVDQLFLRLFTSIDEQRKGEIENKHSFIIGSIMDYINQEYADPSLSLKSIAGEFKISSGYLGQIFKEETQQSVAQYIHDLRLEKVLQLLKNTNISVKEIVYKVGYSNEANFYKIFKKQFGITPNEYRQKFIFSKSDR